MKPGTVGADQEGLLLRGSTAHSCFSLCLVAAGRPWPTGPSRPISSRTKRSLCSLMKAHSQDWAESMGLGGGWDTHLRMPALGFDPRTTQPRESTNTAGVAEGPEAPADSEHWATPTPRGRGITRKILLESPRVWFGRLNPSKVNTFNVTNDIHKPQRHRIPFRAQ